jgi:hypothetical protein
VEAAVMAIVDQVQICECKEDGTEAEESSKERFGRPLRTVLPPVLAIERLP